MADYEAFSSGKVESQYEIPLFLGYTDVVINLWLRTEGLVRTRNDALQSFLLARDSKRPQSNVWLDMSWGYSQVLWAGRFPSGASARKRLFLCRRKITNKRLCVSAPPQRQKVSRYFPWHFLSRGLASDAQSFICLLLRFLENNMLAKLFGVFLELNLALNLSLIFARMIHLARLLVS